MTCKRITRGLELGVGGCVRHRRARAAYQVIQMMRSLSLPCSTTGDHLRILIGDSLRILSERSRREDHPDRIARPDGSIGTEGTISTIRSAADAGFSRVWFPQMPPLAMVASWDAPTTLALAGSRSGRDRAGHWRGGGPHATSIGTCPSGAHRFGRDRWATDPRHRSEPPIRGVRDVRLRLLGARRVPPRISGRGAGACTGR